MSLTFIDTHAHLDFPQFDGERELIVKDAQEKGVSKIINIGCDMERARKSIDLAERFDNVWASVGVHPSDIKSALTNNEISDLEEMAKHPKVVAIGEIGLDYFHKSAESDFQKQALIQQIRIANKSKKPVVIHTREAGGDILELFAQETPKNAVIHCFTENQAFANTVLEMGYFISLTGILTYPNAKELRVVVKSIPLNRIMLETDCPFLAPQAFRGDRNQPAYIPEIALQLAELKDVSLQEVAEITTQNAENFFDI